MIEWWLELDPALRIVLAFTVLSAVANWATAPADPAEWERIKLEEPRRAGAILALRGLGIYPAKILRGLSMVVRGGK